MPYSDTKLRTDDKTVSGSPYCFLCSVLKTWDSLEEYRAHHVSLMSLLCLCASGFWCWHLETFICFEKGVRRTTHNISLYQALLEIPWVSVLLEELDTNLKTVNCIIYKGKWDGPVKNYTFITLAGFTCTCIWSKRNACCHLAGSCGKSHGVTGGTVQIPTERTAL